MSYRWWSLAVFLQVVACFVGLSKGVRAEQGPQERYQAAVGLYDEKRTPEARDAFATILSAGALLSRDLQTADG